MWDAFTQTWGQLTPRQRVGYVLLTLAQASANVFDLIGIASVGLLAMAVASGSIDFNFAGIYRLTIDETPPMLIVGLVVLAALSFLLKALFNLGLSLALVRYMAEIEVTKSSEIAGHILEGSLADLRRYSPADIHYAVNASSAAMFSGILSAVSNIFTGSGLILMILGSFVLVNPVAALVVGVYLIVVVVIIQWVIGGRLKALGAAINKGSVETTSSILDSVNSFREVSVLRKQAFFLERYVHARWILAKTRATNTVLSSVPRIVIEQGLMLGVLGFVSWQLLGDDSANGLASVGVFVVGSVRIIGAVMPVQNAYSNLKTTVVKAELAQQLLKDVDLASGARENLRRALEQAPPLEGVHHEAGKSARGLGVELKDVDFAYPDADEPAVSGIRLSAEPGGFIAFIGPSGAGKTTLADLVLGLNLPDKGTVLIDGRSPLEIREKHPGLISYVPQKPGMVSGTIAQNIALGIPDDKIDEEWVWECLRLAALDDVVHGMPGGIHSSLGKQSDQLSGGQLQRLGLARALYPKPRLVILDEATSALDAGSEAAVSKNIRELGESVTLIVIAHRLSTIQHADCVYVVDEGKIIASGPFNTLRKTVPMIEEYVRLMSFDDTEG
jgi:ABC-type multidrug transport system fused ATPase/permease subunit